jgi:hypothetical protein
MSHVITIAKPGPWRSIRSYRCWCRTAEIGGGEIVMQVAIRDELFAQVHADRRLCGMGMNTFGRRATRYGVGSTSRDERPHGCAAVVLSPEFVAELTAGMVTDDDVGSDNEGESIGGQGGG